MGETPAMTSTRTRKILTTVACLVLLLAPAALAATTSGSGPVRVTGVTISNGVVNASLVNTSLQPQSVTLRVGAIMCDTPIWGDTPIWSNVPLVLQPGQSLTLAVPFPASVASVSSVSASSL